MNIYPQPNLNPLEETNIFDSRSPFIDPYSGFPPTFQQTPSLPLASFASPPAPHLHFHSTPINTYDHRSIRGHVADAPCGCPACCQALATIAQLHPGLTRASAVWETLVALMRPAHTAQHVPDWGWGRSGWDAPALAPVAFAPAPAPALATAPAHAPAHAPATAPAPATASAHVHGHACTRPPTHPSSVSSPTPPSRPPSQRPLSLPPGPTPAPGTPAGAYIDPNRWVIGCRVKHSLCFTTLTSFFAHNVQYHLRESKGGGACRFRRLRCPCGQIVRTSLSMMEFTEHLLSEEHLEGLRGRNDLDTCQQCPPLLNEGTEMPGYRCPAAGCACSTLSLLALAAHLQTHKPAELVGASVTCFCGVALAANNITIESAAAHESSSAHEAAANLIFTPPDDLSN